MVGMPAQMQEELCDQGEWEATPDGKRWPKPCANRQPPTANRQVNRLSCARSLAG